jgi:hypothetical protein
MTTIPHLTEELYGPQTAARHAQRAATQPAAGPRCPRCFVAFGEAEPALPGELCAVCAYGEEEPPQDPPAPRATPPAVLPCPEAVFSLTLKGTMGGHEALLTARGATFEAFAAHVAQLHGLLDAPAAHRPPPTPAAPPAAAAAPAPEASTVCPLHGVAMTRQSNERGWWLSHPTADGGWCKGKARRGR